MPNESPARDPREIITPDAFMVATELLGLPLAAPRKRLWAILIDLALVGLLSLSGSLSFALALGLLCHQLLRGWRSSKARHTRALALVVAVAVGSGVFWLGQQIDDGGDESEDKAEAVAEAMELARDARENPELAGLEQAIQALKKENRELRDARQPSLLAWGEGFLDDIGFGFGWAAAYFTLLTAWWNGQTIGKRAFGMRVLRLNGKRLSVWNSFERAGGYAAGLATGLLGFAQVYWDPNRQAIHDKICGTVVVDARHGAPATAPAEHGSM